MVNNRNEQSRNFYFLPKTLSFHALFLILPYFDRLMVYTPCDISCPKPFPAGSQLVIINPYDYLEGAWCLPCRVPLEADEAELRLGAPLTSLKVPPR